VRAIGQLDGVHRRSPVPPCKVQKEVAPNEVSVNALVVVLKLPGKGLGKGDRCAGIGGARCRAGWNPSVRRSLETQDPRGDLGRGSGPPAFGKASHGRAQRKSRRSSWLERGRRVAFLEQWLRRAGKASNPFDVWLIEGVTGVQVPAASVGGSRSGRRFHSNVIVLIMGVIHFHVLVLGIVREALHLGRSLLCGIPGIVAILEHRVGSFFIEITVVLDGVVAVGSDNRSERLPSGGRDLGGRSIHLGVGSDNGIVKV